MSCRQCGPHDGINNTGGVMKAGGDIVGGNKSITNIGTQILGPTTIQQGETQETRFLQANEDAHSALEHHDFKSALFAAESALKIHPGNAEATAFWVAARLALHSLRRLPHHEAELICDRLVCLSNTSFAPLAVHWLQLLDREYFEPVGRRLPLAAQALSAVGAESIQLNERLLWLARFAGHKA